MAKLHGWLPVMVLALALPGDLGAARPQAGNRKADPKSATRAAVAPSRGPAAPNVVGTLTYDNNVPFSRNGSDGGTVGNLFNVGVVDPHSVAGVTFRIAGNYGTGPGAGAQMVMTVWDQNAASFMVLQRQLLSGLPYIPYPPNANTVTMFTAMVNLTMPVVGHNGAFVGGLRNTDYTPCAGNVLLNTTCDGVALTMGGPDPGMGFHGHRVPFNSTMFVPVINTVAGAGTVVPGVNAIFRVTGDNLPVELMDFGVE